MGQLTIVAEDVNSPLVRNELWVGYGRLWPAMFQLSNPGFAIVSKKDQIGYAIVLDRWLATRDIFFQRIRRRPELLARVMRQSEVYGRELNRYSLILRNAQIEKWSATQLTIFYRRYTRFQRREYAVGVLLPLLDLFGRHEIEELLRETLRQSLRPSDVDHAFEVLTTPIHNSFARDQEIALLELATRWYRRPALRASLRRRQSLEFVRTLQARWPNEYTALQRHVAEWDWTYFVYAGPAWTADQFVNHAQELTRKDSPTAVLSGWRAERRLLLRQRARYLRKLKCDPKTYRLVALAERFVWSKPRRKDYQSRTYRDMERWYREVARRTGHALPAIRSATIDQLELLLRGKKVPAATLDRQYRVHVALGVGSSVRVLSGRSAEMFLRRRIKTEEYDASQTELKGTVAYRGKVRGIARLIFGPADMEKMKRGDILVSPATTPSVVPAMKLAGAIVANEGGLTCHAAIVSRELRKPCVVGTRVATKAFKDGDLIEVDAVKGIVRKV